MQKLYRALITSDHIERWRARAFTSFQNVMPGKWHERWYTDGSQEPKDYPLQCAEGLFTESARDAFLRLAPKYRREQVWSQDDARQASELAGVAAFTDPQSAYQYGFHLKGHARFVEFDGEIVGGLPEQNSVIAQVVDASGPLLKAIDFAAKYHCKNPGFDNLH